MAPSRSQTLAVAFLATACIVGGAAGWGLRSWAVAKRRPGNRDSHAMVSYLTVQLGLSPMQQDSVSNVLERHRMEMDSIWRATRPRVAALRQAMQGEIEDQLSPAQQGRFRELVARHERERRAADSASEELWDADHDGVPQAIDKCADTPSGAPVDRTGCTLATDQNASK